MAIQKNVLTPGISIITEVVIVMAAVYWWQQRPADQGASLTPPHSTSHLPRVSWNKPRDNQNESSVQGKSAPVIQAPTSIRQRMKTDKDWYALAKEILPLAQAGNPEAQYVLFYAHGVCHRASGAQYESSQAARDDAIRLFPTAPQMVSKFQTEYTKCHGFFTADAQSIGDPWDWLKKATDAGYAPAQAMTASERFSQDDLKAAVRAGGSPTDPMAQMPPIGGDANPRDLLAAAVQSGDPDALREIGELQGMLNPNQPRDVSQIIRTAWGYVACQRALIVQS